MSSDLSHCLQQKIKTYRNCQSPTHLSSNVCTTAVNGSTISKINIFTLQKSHCLRWHFPRCTDFYMYFYGPYWSTATLTHYITMSVLSLLLRRYSIKGPDHPLVEFFFKPLLLRLCPLSKKKKKAQWKWDEWWDPIHSEFNWIIHSRQSPQQRSGLIKTCCRLPLLR